MGQLITLSDNSFLREHPYGDPFTSPFGTPEHESMPRFIFPGDEILLWHKVTLPADTGIGGITIANINLIAARLQVIAKKLQVYSEEYAEPYESTRTFILDSFVTAFNNSNAPQQIWSGSYAPNVHLTQDRNFKLPSGDLRRQIKFFTDYPVDNQNWVYYFYFPILFRWEYWLSLLGVSPDFFTLAQSQNGQNHWWYHYFTSVWNLFSRLEIDCTILGQAYTVRSELSLTPGVGNVNDYNSNTDYILKSVKTAKIGATPSNTPAFVYAGTDTKVVAALKKNTAWAGGEKAGISAVVWIEPFEGAGTTARTRGSSVYQITPESVFKGTDIGASDADGLNITDGGGNYVILNPTGKGAQVLFNSSDDTKVTIAAVIDYQKLALVYPGVTKFTLYARLYNGRITISDPVNRFKGEEIKQDAVLVNPPIDTTICVKREPLCPYSLDVFADESDSDELKNDKSSFYEYGDATIRKIQFFLTKLNDCDGPPPSDAFDIGASYNNSFNRSFDIADSVTLPTQGTLGSGCADAFHEVLALVDDNSLGRFFSYGKSNDFLDNDFEDDYGKKYTGWQLEWRKVLQAHGPGRYQVVIVKTDVFGNSLTSCDPRVFCLKPYHCNLADKTVRVEMTNDGLRGTLFDPNNFVDYAGGWYSQLRLKAVFRYMGSGYQKEVTQYDDRLMNAKRPYINEQQPKLSLHVRPIPGWMDWVLSTEMLQADEILVTDYNLKNRHPLVKTPVEGDGDFTPRDTNLSNVLADVQISFAYGQNNLRKRNTR